MGKPYKVRDLQIYTVPAAVIDVADRRTRPMLLEWALRGTGDLKQLLVSVYLQGIEDGYSAKEREIQRGEA